MKYLLNKDIDKRKWDACIHASVQRKVYALSWYLDAATSSSWNAIIFEDYQYVFPIPVNNKIPFYQQVYTPELIQQLGLFGPDNHKEYWLASLQETIKRFKKVKLQCNDNIPYVEIGSMFLLEKRINYILPLSLSYENIYKMYSRNLTRNIKKASGHKVYIILSPKPYTSVLLAERYTYIPSNLIDKVQNLLHALYDHGALKIYQCMTESGELLASVQIVDFMGRMIPLLSQTTDNGKEIGAYHFLLDHLIKSYANSEYIFDFEGSEMPGVDKFMASYGTTNKPYYTLDIDNLPIWMKLGGKFRQAFNRY